MNIYIDGLFYKCTGIGRYYESITKELAKRGISIITTIPKRFQDDFKDEFLMLNNIKPIFVPYEKFSSIGFIHQSFILKLLEKKVELFFFPHINLPFYIPRKTIITIHDLIPFTQYWDRSKAKSNILKFLLNRAIKYSLKIVCVSKTIENELHSFDKRTISKTIVVYEYVDDKFKIQSTEKKLIDKPYILFIGNRKKHKNIGLLLKAFNLIKNKIPHYLVIVGSKEKKFDEIDALKERFNLKGRIIEYISLGDEVIKNIYQHADLFVFPSLFEGFGLPPLEAVAMGCPTLLSDIPILREIFGEAGEYFNPFSAEDLAKKIYEILKEPEKRKNLLEKQKQRLSFFDKNKIIDSYIRLFEKVVAEKI